MDRLIRMILLITDLIIGMNMEESITSCQLELGLYRLLGCQDRIQWSHSDSREHQERIFELVEFNTQVFIWYKCLNLEVYQWVPLIYQGICRVDLQVCIPF